MSSLTMNIFGDLGRLHREHVWIWNASGVLVGSLWISIFFAPGFLVVATR